MRGKTGDDMEQLLNELTAEPTLPWQVIIVRLFAAVFFCGLIGLERESRQRPAGLPTHMMVGLAAALYCLLMQDILYSSEVEGSEISMDPLRIINAVTNDVAFLATGMIVFSQGKIQGLTTGTSLWLAAAVGVSAGLGAWVMAAVTTVPALIIIRGLEVIEKKAGTYENGARPESD